MSESPNTALVRRLYDSGMAPEVTAEILAPDLVWDITPGFPYGGIYHGWESVGRDFFGRLLPDFASFAGNGDQFFAAGDDHVFVLGHYHAVSKTGTEADARFIHLWTIRDRKLTHLRQAADSHVVREVLNS
ncbi:nuclear transport factor 2 family protein [Kribbella sp. NPDC005582]|uniref:nuclear transport factor 2 family protein n=1 Tax=Kribbella sp. NPDC005582 TaxID=3156893 RepID=UPI0033B7C53C